MGFNIHSLAFKQSMLILAGITVVFGILFGVIGYQMEDRLSQMIDQKGEEISQANVNYIDKLFNAGRKVGDEIAATLGSNEMTKAEMDQFLYESLTRARNVIPQIVAVVVAYEPGMGPETKTGEYMRLARYTDNEIKLITGADYQKEEWYYSTRDSKTRCWQEPFIGVFVHEPIAVYTQPIFRKDKNGDDVLVGVLAVDMSIDFLKNTVSSIPVSNSGYAMILSQKNAIVAHPKNLDFGAGNTELVVKKVKTDKGIDFDKASQKSDKGIFQGTVAGGEISVIYYTTIKSNNWTFLIVWPAQKLFEDQRAIVKFFGLVCLIGYVIMLVIVLVTSFRVTRPLNQLTKAADKLGHGNFNVSLPSVEGKDEVAQLASAFSNMRTSLEDYIGKQKNMGRIERELDFARNIQLGILPKDETEEHSEDDRHELAPFMLPAKEVGGDFYDFFKIDNDHLCVMVGDVSGKGVPAALFMMVSRIILRVTAKNVKSVVDVFNKTNYALAIRNRLNLFVTVWMGVIDLRTGHVEFASAGHNPPVVRHRDGKTEFVKSKSGLVMAAMEDTQYKLQTMDLLPGDTLFLYTDGVTEAIDAGCNLFGDDRLLKTLAGGGDLNSVDTCAFVKKELDKYVGEAPQFDDITMLSVKYKGTDEPVWERYEKTVDVAENSPHELKSFVEDILTPMDGSAKEQMQNAWDRYEKMVDVIPENQDVLTAFVEGILAPMDGSLKSQMQINIAIDEIYSNIVKFSGATKVTLVVEVRKATMMAKLTFIDNGVPYNPLQQADPDTTLSAEEREIGGLGIFIVKKTMDEVSYRRNGDCNEFSITKTL